MDFETTLPVSIFLIQFLAPSILVLALSLPACMGFAGKDWAYSISLGWMLFVFSFLFQDLLSPLLAGYFHGVEGVKAVAVDQPGTVAALFTGWFPALLSHFVGFVGKRLFSFFNRLQRKRPDSPR